MGARSKGWSTSGFHRSTEQPERAAASAACVRHGAEGDQRQVAAFQPSPRPPDRGQVAVEVDVAAAAPVEQLVLEDEAGIGVVEAGQQGLKGLLRSGRVEQFEPWEARPEALVFARVKGPHRQPAAARQTQQQRRRLSAAEEPAPGVQADLRGRLGGEIGELELDDRLPARLRCPQGEADHGRFGQRHVDHPLRSEALDEPLAGLEGRAVEADVLAGQEGGRVVRQEIFQGQTDGIAVFHAPRRKRLDPLRHREGSRTGRSGNAVAVAIAGAGRMVGVDGPAARRLRPGHRHRLGHGVAHLCLDGRVDRRHLRLGQPTNVQQLLPRPRQRIVLAPSVHERGGHVEPLVVGRVAVQPQGHALQDGRRRLVAHGVRTTR